MGCYNDYDKGVSNSSPGDSFSVPGKPIVILSLFTILIMFVLLITSTIVFAEENNSATADDDISDYLQLSLEDLMKVQLMVTSVSKRPERLEDAAAAVFVLTNEDIRRSGVTHIADALRMVPGVNVAHFDKSKWAVSVRGFNDRYSNKLLVLIDGRSVYTTLDGGVDWAAQDLLLSDIERIEVIRGPGGALWGANAVNGVINIITKSAEYTQGGQLQLGAGTESGKATARYGDKITDNTYYRIWVKGLMHDNGVYPTGGKADDDWDAIHAGFRLDSAFTPEDHLMLSGQLYDQNRSQRDTISSMIPPFSREIEDELEAYGGHFLARWDHTFDNDQVLTVQSYFDSSISKNESLSDDEHIYDLDVQYYMEPGKRHRVVVGGNYRLSYHGSSPSYVLSFAPTNRQDNLFSCFISDEISFFDERLRLILESKFEHNDYTGFEIQPSARIAWHPNDHSLLWASVSRVVRLPSRMESDSALSTFAAPFVRGVILGNPDMEAEKLITYELGYRNEITSKVDVDVALFYNDYDKLRTLSVQPFQFGWSPYPHMIIPIKFGNEMKAESYGMEIATEWRPNGKCAFRAAYSYFHLDTELFGNAVDKDTTTDIYMQTAPEHSVLFGFNARPTKNTEFDIAARWIDELKDLDVDDYITADIRIGWHARENLMLELIGRNLIESEHLEYGPGIYPFKGSLLERSIYGRLTWEF